MVHMAWLIHRGIHRVVVDRVRPADSDRVMEVANRGHMVRSRSR